MENTDCHNIHVFTHTWEPVTWHPDHVHIYKLVLFILIKAKRLDLKRFWRKLDVELWILGRWIVLYTTYSMFYREASAKNDY